MTTFNRLTLIFISRDSTLVASDTISISILCFRQNIGGKVVADTASASTARSKPLETKKSSSGKPLQKVAPVYVKKVVAEVVSSVEQIEEEEK